MEESDDKHMQAAVDAALQCSGTGDPPTPYVGAVAVRGDTVLATAYRGERVDHEGKHAEYVLLEKKLTGQQLAGATVYTTLEPCTRRGPTKTPCVEWLISRRVGKVVIGMLDPNPVIRGKGYIRLREAGIEVSMFNPKFVGVLEEANRRFIQHIRASPINNALDKILDVATRPGSGAQRIAIDDAVQTCKAALCSIEIGRIPIKCDDGSYFDEVFRHLPTEHCEPEAMKAFINLTAFSPPSTLSTFRRPVLFETLEEKVRSGLLTVEYVFLLPSRDWMKEDDVEVYLSRYKPFTNQIRLLFRDAGVAAEEYFEENIVLLEHQQIAFTHHRDSSRKIKEPVLWEGELHFDRLRAMFNNVYFGSELYFTAQPTADAGN